ncbi:MAG: serine/threonine-protein kinase [Planctomycetota bacterium]
MDDRSSDGPSIPDGSLSADDWVRVREALEGALDVSESKRRAWVVDRLGGDVAIVERALDLLHLDDESTSMRTPLERGLPDSGLSVGPWETRRLLGTGGMGAVYLASRVDGAFERLVALKLIRPHLGSDEVLARFRRERQVQANLQHPGIARMLDGGAADDGSPYIVMEYVEGLPIDRYCDEYRLTVRERVEQFRRVVDAVAHAHEQRIVHRDIKPSNILVASDGQPKLLDFGIAKVIDPERVSTEGEVTRDVLGFVTPAYASPEQYRGLPTTAATDVYSLGVLLYRLLCGRPPLEFEGLSAAEIERRLSRDEPVPPSENVADDAAEQRCTSMRGLRAAVRGDLDRIALFCLRKEPQRRYGSVAALRDDLDRYLGGLPVEARRDTPAYRLLKFVERHRAPVVAAGLAIIVLVVGLAHAMRQNALLTRANASIADQKSLADRRLASLRTLRQKSVEELRSSVMDVPGALAASERLLQVIRDSLDEEAEAAGGDEELLVEIGRTYQALGLIYFGGRDSHLGRSDDARECYERAAEALLRAHELAPRDRQVFAAIAEVNDQLAAVCMEEDRVSDACASQLETLKMLSGFTAEERRKSLQLVYAASLANSSLSRYHQTLGNCETTCEFAQAAVDAWTVFLEANEDSAAFFGPQLAVVLIPLANAHLAAGDAESALVHATRALPGLREAKRMHPGQDVVGRSWILAHRALGNALSELGRDGAEEAYREALSAARSSVERDANDVRAQRDVTISLITLGAYLRDTGRVEDADAILDEALGRARADLNEQPASARARRRAIRAELEAGDLRLAQEDLLGASESFGAVLGRYDTEAGDSLPYHLDRAYLARALLGTARVQAQELQRSGASDEPARARAYERAVEALDRAGALLRVDVSAGIGGPSTARQLEEVDELRGRLED